jgi:secondary thiamine-phosphate synthase enzyme
MNYSETIKLKIKSQEFFEITDKVESIIKKSEIQNGICSIFAIGSTSAVLINENEPMIIQDFKDSLEVVASEEKLYHHAENAHSHIRAAFIGNSQTIPIKDGKIILGTWQSIMIVNFDVDNREREVVVTVIGD